MIGTLSLITALVRSDNISCCTLYESILYIDCVFELQSSRGDMHRGNSYCISPMADPSTSASESEVTLQSFPTNFVDGHLVVWSSVP